MQITFFFSKIAQFTSREIYTPQNREISVSRNVQVVRIISFQYGGLKERIFCSFVLPHSRDKAFRIQSFFDKYSITIDFECARNTCTQSSFWFASEALFPSSRNQLPLRDNAHHLFERGQEFDIWVASSLCRKLYV